MASVIERRTVRADGPEKVTGSGRYTADLTFTGMLHAKLRYAGVAARPHHADRHDGRQGDARRVRRAHAGGRAGRPLRPVHQGPHAVRARRRPLRGRDRRRRRRADARARAGRGRRDRGRHRAAAGRQRPRGRARRRRHRRSTTTGSPTRPTTALERRPTSRRSPRSSSATSRRACAEADEVVTSRYVADASHAVPIEPRAIVAQWQGEKLTVWSSTQVPFDTRAGLAETLAAARAQRARRSCRSSAAASAASAASTRRRTSPRSRARRAAP